MYQLSVSFFNNLWQAVTGIIKWLEKEYFIKDSVAVGATAYTVVKEDGFRKNFG